ncbi:unnamed protein product [Didymodactylos carnosus]|uniref:Uncharacterized protein n=1 Tax=Didymodactylos carnosus TaxID=1234261 RepID=A0A815PIG5_9BILA|nr:unnamed protein product [Didymodactylos carnosus]CAF4323044.1 unnamed protein product [Didymodactylos carnosus]
MLGNASFIVENQNYLNKFGHSPTGNGNEQLRIRTHLEYVENLIRNQTSTSSSSLLQLQALDYLNDYWNIGQFPQHDKYYQHRLPRFIDHNDIHCAVGYMISRSPAFEYVPKQINKKYEYSDVDQIKNNNLDKWMNLYQFSLNELSMIQPTYSFMCSKDQTNNRCLSGQCLTVGGDCLSLDGFEPSKRTRKPPQTGNTISLGAAV